MEFTLGSIIISVKIESDSIRVESSGKSVILPNQSIESVVELLSHNFSFVTNHYTQKINNSKSIVHFADIEKVSIEIVLHYLYMYNLWRTSNNTEQSLVFTPKDFSASSTYDMLFHYFKKTHPKTWESICGILIGINTEELQSIYNSRQAYYNK